MTIKKSSSKNHHPHHHPKNHHQNHDFLDDDFDDDFDQNHDFWDDELMLILSMIALMILSMVCKMRYHLLTMSNWHVTVSLQFKPARYGLLTIQTGALRSPYNSNWRVTVSLQFFKLVYDIFMNGYYPFAFGAPGSARA